MLFNSYEFILLFMPVVVGVYFAIGHVYDFDVPNELTVNRLLYKDPYHAGKEVKEKVVLDVWEDK